MNEKIEKKFKKAFSQLGETIPVFNLQTKQHMLNILEEILKANKTLNKISSINQTIAVKAGLSTEVFHSKTHNNLDAILNNENTKVFTDAESSVVLLKNGKLYAIGDNRYGQLGINGYSKTIRYFNKVYNLERELLQIVTIFYGIKLTLIFTRKNEKGFSKIKYKKVYTCGEEFANFQIEEYKPKIIKELTGLINKIETDNIEIVCKSYYIILFLEILRHF